MPRRRRHDRFVAWLGSPQIENITPAKRTKEIMDTIKHLSDNHSRKAAEKFIDKKYPGLFW